MEEMKNINFQNLKFSLSRVREVLLSVNTKISKNQQNCPIVCIRMYIYYIVCICIRVWLLVKYSNASNKRRIKNCGAYYRD